MDNSNRLDVLKQRPISEWSYPRVLVGIPLERSISFASKVFYPFMRIAMDRPAFVPESYGRTDVVRNKMVTKLLQSQFTHLLMLDVDHIHPSDIITRLAKWVLLDPDIKVVSGLNFRRGMPFDPVCRIYGEGVDPTEPTMIVNWEQGLIKVDEVGGGSLLVHRSVFETLEPPWFYNVYDEVWANSWPGEDIGFSRKCAKAGIGLYVDTTTTSPHCTEGTITEDTFRRFLRDHPDEVRNV